MKNIISFFRGLYGHIPSSLYFLAVVTLPLFASCQSATDETMPSEGEDNLCTINFAINNYQQISLDDLSDLASTRAQTVPTNHPSTLAHLIVAVFDAESGQPVIEPIQHDYADYETDPYSYPMFTVTLPYGTYRIAILGYNGSKACQITSANEINWAEGYVPHTFLYTEELTIDKNTVIDKKISLRRVVSAFHLTAEDAVPADLKKMRFISTTDGGTILDATTGFAMQSTGYKYDINVPSDYAGEKGLECTFYIFLPEQELTTNLTVQALGTEDEVLFERNFTDVPLRINTMTTWRGEMFTKQSEEGSMGFTFEWDTEWTDIIDLNDEA